MVRRITIEGFISAIVESIRVFSVKFFVLHELLLTLMVQRKFYEQDGEEGLIYTLCSDISNKRCVNKPLRANQHSEHCWRL